MLALQTEILNEVASDPTLSVALDNVQYASGTGANNVGFQPLPAGADDPATLAAPGATLATIGQVFNAASYHLHITLNRRYMETT
jgi:hypothetical protein